MANEEHLAMLKQGVQAWNKWRRANTDISPDLSGVSLQRIDLTSANLIRANIRGADLSLAKLNDADLSYADLSRAILGAIDLSAAYLTRTDFTSADLKHANLVAADLTGAVLAHADLSDANISRACLNGANLSAAKLRNAYINGTNLTGANLRDANLSWAELSHSNLTHANLRGAILSYADLNGVDFGNAEIGWTSFMDADLNAVEGLETVIHHGPSSIGIDTIYRCKGKIPEVFLRSAGIPDNLMVYIASLTGESFEFYSAFISYSSKNTDIAERLYADLQVKRVRCWFAPEDIKIGDKFRQRIDEAIRIHDKLLLILSEDSMASAWVEDEVEAALERERRENRLVLFPIRIDDAVEQSSTAWAASLRRTRHIGDFSKWKEHDAYKKAFDRLLRDLKAEQGK